MFSTSFQNSEKLTQINKNPWNILYGFNRFLAKFLKTLPRSNETWSLNETTQNCAGLLKERFGQVSKIPKSDAN